LRRGARRVFIAGTMDSAELDRRYLWHPFTQMREWNAGEPLVIVEADGAVLRDAQGREYLDGNSSIWTNLHGHRRAEMDAAIGEQLGRVAHSSFLGLTNDVAPRFAFELLQAFTGKEEPEGWRAFFSDDGSTAVEAGLKMIHQARRQRGEEERRVFLSLGAGYHGDTVGAMSLGHSALFHGTYRGLMFESREVMSPACYRCPFNRAKPERGTDARLSRKCEWECVGEAAKALDAAGDEASAFVMEPRAQGAAGMTMHPHGYLARVAALCRDRGVWLMLDEVMTGFGRTGAMFACQHEGVVPDVLALGKGITGGYLPLAATVASAEIFAAFDGEYSEFRTFFHGHSYSGNQLGCAAALASLRLLEGAHSMEYVRGRAAVMERLAQRFWEHPNVGDVRCEGMICAIELVEDFATRRRFPVEQRVGFCVSEAARAHGLITRCVGDVLVLMPPYCVSEAQLERAVEALWRALAEVVGECGADDSSALEV
jgi:adenosylmethionine-8-amino-7-oxononanoate aminotransferase